MTLRLLADENLPLAAVRALRALGHDVSWVKESAASLDDHAVLAWARRESRILLTLDKDFGELAFNAHLPADCGVLFLRLPPIPSSIAALLCRLLSGDADFRGRFVVVEPARIRERPLPRR